MQQFLRLRKVIEHVPYSKAQLYRLIKAGRFPKPYDLGGNGRAVAWLKSEIDAWISERIEARGEKVA